MAALPPLGLSAGATTPAGAASICRALPAALLLRGSTPFPLSIAAAVRSRAWCAGRALTSRPSPALMAVCRSSAPFSTTTPAFRVPPAFPYSKKQPRVPELPVPCLPQFANETGVRESVWRLSDFRKEERRLAESRNRYWKPEHVSETTLQAVDTVRNQNRYYAIIEIKGLSFLVTEGDVVSICGTYEVNVGDILDINLVREIGSRDFAIFGRRFVSPDYFDIKATVIERARVKDLVIFRFKKKSYRKVVVQRHFVTRFRISKLDINKLE